MVRSNCVSASKWWSILLLTSLLNFHSTSSARVASRELHKRRKESRSITKGRASGETIVGIESQPRVSGESPRVSRETHPRRGRERRGERSPGRSRLEVARGLKTFGVPVANFNVANQIRILSYNLLAPPYVRPDPENDTSADARMRKQQALVQAAEADVLCLQEFWTDNQRQVRAWADWALKNDYLLYTLPRHRNKADGCATLVRSSLAPRDAKGFSYNDTGYRVALEVTVLNGLRIFNTHWTFNHHRRDAAQRLQQARKLIEYIDESSNGDATPAIVAGDLNGNADEPAVQELATAGFTLMSAFNTSRPQPFISHKAHTGDGLGCDFIAVRGGPKFLNWSMLLPTSAMDGRGRLSDHLPVASTLALVQSGTKTEDEEEQESRHVPQRSLWKRIVGKIFGERQKNESQADRRKEFESELEHLRLEMRGNGGASELPREMGGSPRR